MLRSVLSSARIRGSSRVISSNKNRQSIRSHPQVFFFSTTSQPRPVVVSRRLWQSHPERLRQAELRKTLAKKQTSNKPEDKPWPRSVVILAAIVASTTIPYCTLWFLLSNESSRQVLLERVFPKTWEGVLRRHYGSPEVDAVS